MLWERLLWGLAALIVASGIAIDLRRHGWRTFAGGRMWLAFVLAAELCVLVTLAMRPEVFGQHFALIMAFAVASGLVAQRLRMFPETRD